MARGSQALLFGSVAALLLLAGFVFGLDARARAVEPAVLEPSFPNPTSIARRSEAALRPVPGLRREPVGGAGSVGGGGCGSSSSLEVRVSSPQAGELELVLRRGSIEWGRGVTRDGRLRFDGLEQGGYLVRAEGDGRLLPELDPQQAWSGPEHTWRRVDVPGSRATVEVELRFVRAAKLAGVVRDAGGLPVPAVLVLVQDTRRPADARRISTDELGCFCVEGLAPSHYAVTVPARGSKERLVALPLEQTLAAGEAAWLELRLEQGRRTIHGRVLDRRWLAVDGLRMVCAVASSHVASKGSGRPPASRIVARARTDADGVFRFDGLPAAELRVALDARELELRADGTYRRLRRGFAPLDVDTLGDDVDLGVLSVERPPSATDLSR